MLRDRKLKDTDILVGICRIEQRKWSACHRMSPSFITDDKVKNVHFHLILAMYCIIIITLKLLTFPLPNEY